MDEIFYIFDFDYTLYKTSENVIIWSPRGDTVVNGKACFRLNPDEYHSYNFGYDEFVDEDSFMEFDSINWEKARPIKAVIDIFEGCSNKMILTARKQIVEPFIRRRFPSISEFVGLGDGSIEAKLKKIDSYREIHKKICVYEDSYKLIKLLSERKISCVHVNYKPEQTILTFNNF